MQRRGGLLPGVMVAGCIAALQFAAAVAAAAEVYIYEVRHPVYGQIGTYSDTIERTATGWRLETRLQVAVRLLGIALHREEAQHSAVWHDGRLASFHGVTTTNGATIVLRGAAAGDAFVLTAPAGTRTLPGDVVPAAPWFAKAGPGTVMSTKTGRIDRAYCTDLGEAVIALHGVELATRHLELITDKRQEAWLSRTGVPVRFRSWESGTPIDFELTADALRGAGLLQPGADANPPARGN